MTMLFWWMKTGKYLCVFCVEALALRNKKKNEVEGRRERERERERRNFQKKKKKKKRGEVKPSLNDFFALEGR